MGYKLTLISETEKMLTSKLVKQLWRNWGCNQFSIKKTSNIESFHHGQQMRKVYAETYRWFDAFIFLIHFQHGGLKGNNRNNIYKNIHRHISRGLSFFSKKLKTALPHTHSHFTGKRTLSFVNMASFGLTNLLNADMSSWGLFELGWGGMGMGAGTLDLPSIEWWSLGPPLGNLPPPNTLGCWFRFGH